MFENFVKYQDRFKYVDSSQEEDYVLRVKKEAHKNIENNQNFCYQSSSSSSEDSSVKKISSNKVSKGSKIKSKKIKLCKMNPDNFLINDNYLNQIENIIKENNQKISKKTALLIPDTNPEILENLQKRKKNYGFFLKALEVDKKYNESMSVKVSKLQKQNERKKTVVESKNVKKSMKQDQEQMKKYVLEKKNKQQIVVDKIQKHAYKLGLQRVRQEFKKIKKQVKEIENKNDLKATNLQIKQKNQIQQLRQQLQKMKQMNRINKLDQVKALKEMQKNVQSNKNLLLTKAEKAHQRKFII